MIAEILVVLRRSLAERANRAPESVRAETALGELLPPEGDWLALQRGIYRNLGCFIPLDDLRVLYTVGAVRLLIDLQEARCAQRDTGNASERTDGSVGYEDGGDPQ